MLKDLGWATYSGSLGSFLLGSATANYVAVPRRIIGMASGVGSVRIGYATGLGNVAWGPFVPLGGTPFDFVNYSPPVTADANKNLVLNVGDGVGVTWIAVGFEFVRSSGVTG